MIEVKSLKKTFGKVEAVKDVSLKAENGKITALLGENGAGKTTTIRMISGSLASENGEVLIDGDLMSPSNYLLRRRLGVLSDQKTIYSKLTTRENIVYYGRLMGLDQRLIDQNIHKMIPQLELSEIIDRQTSGFSTGQKIKVALARILVYQPSTILLDEPSSGLDVRTKRNLRAILQRLRDEGMCLLLSTHIMEEVERLCDEVFVIHEGKTLCSGTVSELLTQTRKNRFEDAFVHLIEESQSC